MVCYEEAKVKNNKLVCLISILLVVNILASCLLGIKVYQLSKETAHEESIRYVMYIGTNDKDTYEQIISTDEAKRIIDKICLKYVSGYTIQEAQGVWTDENDTFTHENTLVCYFDDVSSEAVYSIADEIIEALNQNSVLIEKNQVVTEFYSSHSE